MKKITEIGSVKIGTHSVIIELVDDPSLYYKSEEKDTLCGFFQSEALTIYLDKKMPVSLYKDTLFHELLHAVWFLSGAGSVEQAHYEEEIMVSVLTPWLIGLLADNHKLLELYAS